MMDSNRRAWKIRTPYGDVTSVRVAWQDSAGRDVWTWRTDRDEPPLLWPSAAGAWSWITSVWDAEDPTGWLVEESI
jgi:hypothetical protein